MKKFSALAAALVIALCLGTWARSDDKHDHDHGHEHGEEESEEHSDEHGDEHGHGHEEEGGGPIGPDKGILEKTELGMRLSPEAIATIAPGTVAWKPGPVTIPYEGLVRIKETKSVFRVRNGFYKRVPARVLSRQNDSLTVQVEGLEAGDLLVTTQAGFLRIAEVILVEGASHSH